MNESGSGIRQIDRFRSAIGFDIGGTAIKAGRLAAGGEVEREASCATPARELPEAIVPAVRSLLEELGAKPTGRSGWIIGVGCAGLVQPESGRVRTSPNLPLWKDVALGHLLEETFGCRPAILNDANAFVLAEARLGAARGVRNLVGLTLGTGVGGGILADGKLCTGRNGFAGEFGHFPLLADGPLCACGARGCLEALVGTSAIRDRYILRAEEIAGAPTGGGSRSRGQSREEEKPLTPRFIAQWARDGDPAARWAFAETGRLLGTAMRGIAHMLDPELFVIGGGISGAADLLLPAARAALRDHLLFPPEAIPEIRPAALGGSAGWIGAALCALEQAG